jgi:hypothetical protein
MSLLDEIRLAQRDAGEAAVTANLERPGLVTSPKSGRISSRDDDSARQERIRKLKQNPKIVWTDVFNTFFVNANFKLLHKEDFVNASEIQQLCEFVADELNS